MDKSPLPPQFERPFWLALTAVLLITVLFLAIKLLGLHDNILTPLSSRQNSVAQHKMDYVYNQILTNSINPIESDQLATTAIKAMLESLNDPYSVYLDKKESRYLNDLTKGEFGGVGITLPPKKENGVIPIIDVIKDSPAGKAGLQKGDHIIAIDGLESQNFTLEEMIEAIRGPLSSSVTLTLQRDTKEFETTLKRAKIEIESVFGKKLDEGFGYIAIREFNKATPHQLRKTLDQLKTEGVSALIIDLRYNAGGLYDSALAIANDFLDEGVIVSSQGLRHYNNKTEKANKQLYVDKNLPVVLLVNRYTASASEVLTAALADNDRATIIGEPTFGKALIQQQFYLNADHTESFKLTTSHYLTPKGLNINKVGVKPPIEVETNFAQGDLVLQKALEHLSSVIN